MKRLAKRMTCPDTGETFDSISEMARWRELQLLEKAGQIRNLRRQVKYPLSVEGRPVKIRSPRYKNGRQCVYTADFVYEESRQNGPFWGLVVEESKGYHTDASRLRIGVFEAIYNVEVRMTGAQKMRKRRRAA